VVAVLAMTVRAGTTVKMMCCAENDR